MFLLNAAVVTFFRGDVVLLGFFLLRIAEAVIVYLLIADEVLPAPTVIRILLYGALFQLALGYLQWYLNHSLHLSIIGEQTLGGDVLGVAKNDVAEGVKQIRPYGTFLHPNILAAYLLAILFISLRYLRGRSLAFWLILLTAGIWFTGSRAVALAVIACFFMLIIFAYVKELKNRKSVIVAALLLLLAVNAWFFANSSAIRTGDPSWQERLNQNVISREMVLARPLGIGVFNFTLEMENFAAEKLSPWEFQPVHNTYFLIANETGFQGLLILFAAIIFFFWKRWEGEYALPLMAFILVTPFDHYLWDSFTGMILVAIVLASLRMKQEVNPVP
ncbi:O-antigen ligase family protein [Candidatus Peregrinibacteria bacterium]|nr:O-antigen ligase family protein [Candidatus Peregrinibacteria bacterium]